MWILSIRCGLAVEIVSSREMKSLCVLLSNKLLSPAPLKSPAKVAASYAPASFPRGISTMSVSATSAALTSKPEATKSIPLTSTQSLISAIPPIRGLKNLGFRPTPEMGLLSLLFSLSMAIGAFFSVAVISIPTMIAFGKLGASVKKLSKVASEEVPGTLSSLKLSSVELNDLSEQLRNLRHEISGIHMGKEKGIKNKKSFRKKKPASNS